MRGLSLLTFLLLSVISAFGEGKISGKVADDKTGETIIGAVVVLKGTTNGSTTDIDGNFMIPVTAGTYVVEVKSPGKSGVAALVITILSITFAGMISKENAFLFGSVLGRIALSTIAEL